MATASPYYPTFACNGFSSQALMLDQPTYKTWQHGRKRKAEGKGDSPRSPEEILGWRAGYIERRKSGSEGGTRHTHWVNGPYPTPQRRVRHCPRHPRQQRGLPPELDGSPAP